jgi:hypothetical protein
MKLKLLIASLFTCSLHAGLIQLSPSEVSLSTSISGTGKSTVEGTVYIAGPFLFEQLSLPTGKDPCHSGQSFCEVDFNVMLTVVGVGTTAYTLTDTSYDGAGLIGNTYAIFSGTTPGNYTVELSVHSFWTVADSTIYPEVPSTITAQITGEGPDEMSRSAVTVDAMVVPEPALGLACGIGLMAVLGWTVCQKRRSRSGLS